MADKIKYMDNYGNERTISAAAVKKNISGNNNRNILDFYQESLSDRLARLSGEKIVEEKPEIIQQYPIGFKQYNDIWRYEPVESKYFFKKMIGESLTEIQQTEACDIICSKDPFQFTDLRFKELNLFWGKRAGKDATISKIFAYQAYRLCCLENPQKYLGMGVGSAVDIVNVSKSGKQAKNVFFKYLTSYIRGTKNVKTGLNWFATHNFWYDIGIGKFRYQSLREGDSIQKEIIDFNRGVACHSLNSDRYTGEGLNIIIAVIDEVGSMLVNKIIGDASGNEINIGLHDSLKTTLDATSKFSKLVCVSYKYGRNCPMSILVNRNKRDSSVFISRRSTFEVRPDFVKSRVKEEYMMNPIKAAMMYEIKESQGDVNTFYDVSYMLEAAQDTTQKYTKNPFKNKAVIVDDVANIWSLLNEDFVGKSEFIYVAHVDLAKGQTWKGGDAIGLSIGHLESMRISLDRRMKEYLKNNLGIVDTEELEGDLRSGVVIDLGCHVVCKPDAQEVRLVDVRKFLINLKLNRNFDFLKITYDGWQSLESVQEFNKYGIESAEFSVDKNKTAYMTEKDLIMLGLFKIYPNRIWFRENLELMDLNNKIDHPEISNMRLEQDNIAKGSKDLADCTAAVSFNLMKEVEENSNPVF